MNAIPHPLDDALSFDSFAPVSQEPPAILSEADVVSAVSAVPKTQGAEVVGSVESFIRRFCILPNEAAYIAVTLWVVHTHLVSELHTSPRLAALSPEPQCGKTRLLDMLNLLSSNAMFSFSASVPAIFRTMGAGQTTLLLDEVDTVFGKYGKNDQHEDLRALLNAGYRRGATIPRCVGQQHEVQHFDVFGAVGMAGIGNLPETILTRSIVIRMRRRAPNERVDAYHPRRHEALAHELRDRLGDWAATVGANVGSAMPELPEGITDRPGEIWEPLIAIADEVGGRWPARAREACVYLVEAAKDRSISLGIRLLTDLRIAFGDNRELPTFRILDELHRVEDAPWADLKGEPLDPRGLARMLAEYEVRATKVGPRDHRVQGYRAVDLYDAWDRYCPPTPTTGGHSGHPRHTGGEASTVSTVSASGGASAGTGTRQSQEDLCPHCAGESCEWCRL